MHDAHPKLIHLNFLKNLKNEDIEWARAYLARHGITLQTTIEAGGNISSMTVLNYGLQTEKKVYDLRNAWRQRKARKNYAGKKPYNIVMSAATRRKLELFARINYLTLTDAFAKLVEEEAWRREDLANKKKEYKEKFQKQQDIYDRELADKEKSNQATREKTQILYDFLKDRIVELSIYQSMTIKPALESFTTQDVVMEAKRAYSEINEQLNNNLGILLAGLNNHDINNATWTTKAKTAIEQNMMSNKIREEQQKLKDEESKDL